MSRPVAIQAAEVPLRAKASNYPEPFAARVNQLVNETDADVVYLEIGDRTPGESAAYPDDDLVLSSGPDGKYRFTHKDGTPY